MTDATAEQSVTADADDKPEPYNGLPGAFPYAFRATDSLLSKPTFWCVVAVRGDYARVLVRR